MTQPAMFVPAAYSAGDRSALRALIRRHPFALLTTAGASGLWATSLPLVFETDDPGDDRLIGHLARRNGHAAALDDAAHVLATFSGPNAYVSSRWYQDRPEVPTWNYVAVQVRATLTPVDDDEGLYAILDRTMQVAEGGRLDLGGLPEGRSATLLPYIRGFRLTITAIDGTTKLSQTHPPADRLRIIRGLLAEGDEGGRAIARLMAQRDA